MLSRLTILFLIAIPAGSQIIPVNRLGPIPVQLSAFLELTAPQLGTFMTISSRFQDYQVTKTLRRSQVQGEIAEETTRDTIDPSALGIRYREIELINREIEAERQRNRTELLAVLTAAQRAKLTTLEQALRLQNTACSAVSFNLLAAPPPTVVIYDPLTPVPGNSLTGILTGVPSSGCGSALNVPVFAFPKLP